MIMIHMKKIFRLKLALLLAVVLGLATLAACSSDKTPNEDATSPAATTAEQTSVPKEPVSMSMWVPLNNSNFYANNKDFGEIPAVQEWLKQTNVKLTFPHPSGDSTARDQQFGVMIASGELPDMMMWNWSSNTKNAAKLYADGQIIKLNDLIDKYAPNLKKLMAEDPEAAKGMQQDNGDIFIFPNLRAGNLNKHTTFDGFMIRQDWLDELGLKQPETIDDWDTVLRAFKEKENVIPFIADNTLGSDWSYEFVTAYGIGNSFYNDNGQVKYGPLQPEFKTFLAKMQQWYKDGLLDNNYLTNDTKTRDALITSSKVGAFGQSWIGGSMDTYKLAFQDTDPKARITAVQYPVLNKGDEPQFPNVSPKVNGWGVVLTKANKHPEESIKMLDYLFSDAGHLLQNFGIEGQTYTMVDGQPVYTDLVLNNPDKLTISDAMEKYMFGANYAFVGYNDDRVFNGFYALPEQQEALKIYSQYADNGFKHLLPKNLTPDEATEISKIMTDIYTLRTEAVAKIITGAQPVDSFDKVIDQMKKMKIDRAIEIRQAALERFNKR